MTVMRRRVALWGPVALWMIIIFGAGTFQTGLGGDLPGGDKFTHILTYGILGIVLMPALADRRADTRVWRLVGLITVVAFVYGGVDEWRQSFLPGRSATGWDVLADALGGAIGAWLYGVLGDHERNGTSARSPELARPGATS